MLFPYNCNNCNIFSVYQTTKALKRGLEDENIDEYFDVEDDFEEVKKKKKVVSVVIDDSDDE